MHGHACKQYMFESCNTSTFNAMRFGENPLTYQCEKEDKMASGFQIPHFYWSFYSDKAVKGLNWCNDSLFCSGLVNQFT